MMKSWQWEIDKNTFDLINLDFFVNYRITTLLGYLSIYVMFVLKVAFLASDIYTLIRLIVFNTWTSDVQPFISYRICRWLFFGCILLSLVLYFYTMIRSIISYRTRNVSLTYINPGASFMYSVRSYKYYCVYNEISSDSFFNFLAFFCYFNLQNCLILLLCDTPRQVINGITIFKILKFNSSMISVIREIAVTNEPEAVILSFMTFSFIVWFIFFVKFLFACLIFFPLNYKIRYVYNYEYGLKQYCCVQINNIVQKFMKVKHTKSLETLKRENLNLHPTIPTIDIDEKSFSANQTLPHKDSSMTLVESINPFDDRKEFKQSFPYPPSAATRKSPPTRKISSQSLPQPPLQQQNFPQQHIPSLFNYQNNESSISVLKSRPIQEFDTISLPSSNSSLSLQLAENSNPRDSLLYNDNLASKRTLMEDLELPPRNVSASQVSGADHPTVLPDSHYNDRSRYNIDQEDSIYEGVRKFNYGASNHEQNHNHNNNDNI